MFLFSAKNSAGDSAISKKVPQKHIIHNNNPLSRAPNVPKRAQIARVQADAQTRAEEKEGRRENELCLRTLSLAFLAAFDLPLFGWPAGLPLPLPLPPPASIASRDPPSEPDPNRRGSFNRRGRSWRTARFLRDPKRERARLCRAELGLASAGCHGGGDGGFAFAAIAGRESWFWRRTKATTKAMASSQQKKVTAWASSGGGLWCGVLTGEGARSRPEMTCSRHFLFSGGVVFSRFPGKRNPSAQGRADP